MNELEFWAHHRVVRHGRWVCWAFLGTKPNQYGRVNINGREWLAHRFAYNLAFGPIPEGLLVCHHCDNPMCMRPSHLFLATDKENMMDSAEKGRLSYAKRPLQIPAVKALAIRRASGSYLEIARKYGASIRSVGRIKRTLHADTLVKRMLSARCARKTTWRNF